MKLAHLADVHLRGKDLDVCRRVLAAVLEEARREGVSWVLSSGDLFDRPGIGDRHASSSQILGCFFSLVEKAGIPWVVIHGNHDRYQQVDALQAIAHHPLVCVPQQQAVRLGDEVLLGCLEWPGRDVWLRQAPDTEYSVWARRSLERLRALFSCYGTYYRVLLGHCDLAEVSFSDAGWCYSEAELLAVGADSVLLGHVHARQSLYAGALRQLHYGEADNPSGWQLIDTERGVIEFREVDAPRYWVVDAEAFAAAPLRPGDYVRVVGTPMAAIPEGVHVQVVAPATELVTRQRLAIDPSSSWVELLSAWLERYHSSVPRETLIELAQEFSEALDLSQESGSLTRLRRVLLRNIGPHRHLQVEFPAGWVGVCGPNGAGKTFLLEALPAALYGSWPHPGRALRDTLTAFPALLEVEFDARGTTWVVRREWTDRDQSVTVWGDGVLRAGPKVRDSEEFLRRLVGPREAFLAAVHLNQSAVGDLVVASDAERMAIMRRLLGLEGWDTAEQAVKAEVDQHVSALRALPELEASLSRYKAEIQRLEQELDIYLSEEATLSQKASQAEEQARKAEDRASLDVEARGRELERARARVAELENRLVGLRHAQFRLPGIRNALVRITADQEQAVRVEELRRRKQECLEQTASLQRAGCAPQYLPCPFIERALAAQQCLSETEEELRRIGPVPSSAELEKRRAALLRELGSLEAFGDPQQLETVEQALAAETQEVVRLETLLAECDTEALTRAKTLRKEADAARARLDAHRQACAQIQGRLQAHREMCTQLQERLTELRGLQTRLERLRILQRAFSREGIPQELIHTALPSLAGLLQEICQEDFRGLFELRLDTVRELRGGGEKEGFSILWQGQRDVRSCSGGEAAAVRAILRTALLLYRGRGDYRVCLLDEPTAHQDGEMAEATIAMLRRLERSGRGQVVLVTHDETLLSGLLHVIRIGGGAGGSQPEG